MSFPLAFRHLVDDASVFPPGLAPLPRAVAEHAGHLASGHAEFVGPFVIGADRLGELTALAGPRLFPGGLRVSVVAGPAALPAVRAAFAGTGRLVPAAVEFKPDAARPLGPQLDDLAAPGFPGTVYVEVPRPGTPEWEQALALVVRHGFRLKLRTGGTEAAAFPAEDEVAAWIAGAVAAGVPFKCTAGLHHAVRHTAPATGFEHHGFLNVLLATARARAGASPSDVRAALAERAPEALARAVTALPAAEAAAAREAFVSYGSCSVLEPLEDLTALGLLGPSTATDSEGLHA
ncbi:hypothetical protein FKN01_13255 [Streptomyces sp. 130]|uniref:hypothetical protein n=1 Tax=Streptomyces sp. 130 TaxID=2591006 RepID=UPI00117D955A|nr:hypothetical protein [Streptomyces sp. 130]TRV78267.1 hypothetical protein FKN01_13255 [Streptomyces sp. 130]